MGRRARTLRLALLLASDRQASSRCKMAEQAGVAAQPTRAHSYRRWEMSSYRPASGCRPCTSVYEKAADDALRVDAAFWYSSTS